MVGVWDGVGVAWWVFTPGLEAIDGVLVVDRPRLDADVVGHERRYGTLEQGAVGADHVFHGHVRLVQLVHHCDRVPNLVLNRQSRQRSTGKTR